MDSTLSATKRLRKCCTPFARSASAKGERPLQSSIAEVLGPEDRRSAAESSGSTTHPYDELALVLKLSARPERTWRIIFIDLPASRTEAIGRALDALVPTLPLQTWPREAVARRRRPLLAGRRGPRAEGLPVSPLSGLSPEHGWLEVEESGEWKGVGMPLCKAPPCIPLLAAMATAAGAAVMTRVLCRIR